VIFHNLDISAVGSDPAEYPASVREYNATDNFRVAPKLRIMDLFFHLPLKPSWRGVLIKVRDCVTFLRYSICGICEPI
jgi:hypothetical protein